MQAACKYLQAACVSASGLFRGFGGVYKRQGHGRHDECVAVIVVFKNKAAQAIALWAGQPKHIRLVAWLIEIIAQLLCFNQSLGIVLVEMVDVVHGFVLHQHFHGGIKIQIRLRRNVLRVDGGRTTQPSLGFA